MSKNEKVPLNKFEHINDVLRMDSSTINSHTPMSFQDSSRLVGDSGAWWFLVAQSGEESLNFIELPFSHIENGKHLLQDEN